MAKAVSRSSTGAGYQDIKSPEALETDALQVNTTMVAPSGTSFPVSPIAGEWFWRSDTKILYRRDSTNTVWEAVVAGSISGVKSGLVLKASFAGTPKKASVAFATAYPDTNYSVNHIININGANNASYIATIENKTAAGFDISMHTGNVSDLIDVEWTTRVVGE
jgi:hypothetical protein